MKNIQRSIQLFEGAIKTEATKKAYLYQLEKFREWTKVERYEYALEKELYAANLGISN